MGWFCALALCLIVPLSSAVSPPKPPEPLIPLNCNETEGNVALAVDLLNEDREEGFVLRPVRIVSVYEQHVENIAGTSVFYIDVNVIETKCSVISGKSWKECNTDIPFHELIHGECKIVYYVSKTQRDLRLVNYNCSTSPVPSTTIVHKCPDCPTIVQKITDEIEAKAKHLAEEFNKNSNQTHHFKLEHIDRVTTQWVTGPSFFISMIIKETECLKTQPDVNLDNCKTLKDSEAHLAFCTGSVYTSPDKQEHFKVSCEVYDPEGDDQQPQQPQQPDNPHRHGHCDHQHEAATTEQSQAAGEAGAAEPDKKEEGKGSEGKCGLDKGKSCGREHKHRHGCHRGRPHHHHHHHHRRCHHRPHCRHHHVHDQNHDHNHTHTHDGHHPHGSSSEETTGQKSSEDKSKGSVNMYYPGEDKSLPTPTIPHLQPFKNVPNPADFPNEPSPLKTCPGGPVSDLPQSIKDFMFEESTQKQ